MKIWLVAIRDILSKILGNFILSEGYSNRGFAKICLPFSKVPVDSFDEIWFNHLTIAATFNTALNENIIVILNDIILIIFYKPQKVYKLLSQKSQNLILKLRQRAIFLEKLEEVEG